MKANRKALNAEDDAVSPVIAVILMVAITVVLAATVYVWVSGFGSNSSQPAKSIAFTSGATLITTETTDATAGDDALKAYIVSAASPGLKYADLTFTLNGASVTISGGNCDADQSDLSSADNAKNWVACSGAFAASGVSTRTTADLVQAGDHLYLTQEGATLSGMTFRVLDSAANSIITTLTVS